MVIINYLHLTNHQCHRCQQQTGIAMSRLKKKKKNVAKVSENKVFSVSKELPLSKFIKEMYELYEICNNNN